jgi:predicted nucleic acid-binding protein
MTGMKMIYLDYNCFQRGFDDPGQVKIQIEAVACEAVFSRAEKKAIRLIWSFMHEDENRLCPFLERKASIARLSSVCAIRLGPTREIRDLALEFQRKARLSAKDALHVACAYSAKCDYFITCDDDLVKRSARLDIEMKVVNPVEYIREVDK